MTRKIEADVGAWLARFETALGAADAAKLGELFAADCHWRDVLALSWSIETVSGRAAVVKALKTVNAPAKPHGFAIDAERAAPREVMRAGRECIEAIYRFETRDGPASGVVRLVPEEGALKAWTLMTALEGLRGHEEQVGRSRPRGQAHARDFRGPNWLDKRNAAAAYEDRDPEVIVVGGGQAGLSIAARLSQLKIDTLIVDRHPRIGDNWRGRYHALTLHNQVQVNHLPYLNFPPTWPTYIPKDMLAGWFESYVQNLELNYWAATEFEGGTYDQRTGRWAVRLRRGDGTGGGAVREMKPRHIVLATGVSGIPNIPALPTLDAFRGEVIHSSRYQDGEAYKGKRAIVIGTGNSGHDIAQDLQSSGAEVILVQRSPTMIVNVEPSAQLPYALYDEGPSLEDCDLITVATPLKVGQQTHKILTERARQMDDALLKGLERIGFKLDFGDDGTGWQFKYLTRGGGYYFNVGCSDLLVEGKIRLAQFTDIERFTDRGARLKSGEELPADLIVLATGYKGNEELVARLFGNEVAARVGKIWGFDDSQELRNMFTRTNQPGLWFIAGSLAQCRIYSKYLALQIKAEELGLLPHRREPAPSREAVAAS